MAYIGRDIEYGVLEKQTLTADSSTVAFDLTYISDANGLIVSVGGIVQEPNVAYTVIGSTLTFTEAPTTGDTVYVVYLGQEMVVSTITPTDYMDYQVGTGDGSDTTPITTLNHSVSLAQDIMVTLNGIRQVPSTDYSVSGTTLTFTTAPADGVAILVYFLMLVRAEGTVVDNSVTDAKIVGMSGSKITTGTVPAGAVSNASIIGMDAAKLTGSFPESMGADLSLSYQRLATLGLHVQNVNNKVAFNLTNSFLDSFEDSTGVDSTNSVNALVSSDEYVTSASELDTATNITPSSNDWDYTFAGGGEWPAAGNALGDNTSGGFVDNTGGDSALSSLLTFDGDVTAEWTCVAVDKNVFGFHEIAEDAKRATEQRCGMRAATTESWLYEEEGSPARSVLYGNAQQTTHNFTDGDVVKLERIAGVFSLYDNDVLVHEWSQTSSNPIRFFFGAPGTPFAADYDNILFTDYSKIQRDGFFNETAGASRASFGTAYAYTGQQWVATRTGTISTIKINIAGLSGGASDAHFEIWSSNGTSPVAQVGTDSGTLSISSTGDKIFTFSTPVPVVKGTKYWAVFQDETMSSTSADLNRVTHGISSMLCGRASSSAGITTIVDDGQLDLMIEIAITATGEPTPDHDTLLLVQSDTTNGSQTFVDSSQNARTVTAEGDAQHSTAQSKFGATSILLDGTGDFLTVPDHADFEFGSGPFTLDFWLYQNSAGSTDSPLSKAGTYAPWSEIPWMFYVQSGQIKFLFSNNGGSGFTLTSTSGVGTGAWIHIAVTRSANVFNLFVNGNLDATTTAAYPMLNNDTPIQIGRYSETYTAADWDGWVDEVRISKVARWDANFTPPTAPYGTSTNTTLSATGTLISTASTADSAVSEVTGALLVKDSVGTNTLGTDLKAYFSSDNGSNWTEAASYDSSFTFDGTTKVIPLGKTTLSNTGTAVKMKVEWANQQASSKVAQLHGWAVNY